MTGMGIMLNDPVVFFIFESFLYSFYETLYLQASVSKPQPIPARVFMMKINSWGEKRIACLSEVRQDKGAKTSYEQN